MLETLLEIRDTILRSKMRTAATGIAVASGLFLLITLLGFSNGIIHTMQQQSQGLALDVINLYPGQTSKPYRGLKAWRYVPLTERDRTMTEDVFQRNVRSTSVQISQNNIYATAGKQTLNTTLSGVYPDYLHTRARNLAFGRFLNRKDMTERRKVAVLNEREARILYGHAEMAVGQLLRISGLTYTVVGVLKQRMEDYGSEMLVPFSTLKHIYNKGENVNQMSVRTRNITTVTQADSMENGLRRMLARTHDFDPTDKSAVWTWNAARDAQSVNQATNVMTFSFWILGLLTMLSGIVGVSNIMLITVKERTHEFGIRKALGARPWNIVRMVILESMIITTLFGYVGMFAGVAFCQWMDKNMGNQTMDMGFAQVQYLVDPTVGLDTCLQATLVMIVAGALAGFFPAWRAAKVQPIEALRG